ncbi:MAG: hypothetical protein WC878_00735 [Candidatus Paceibacterota bacterium]|jgi:chemotaxis protein CheY-P-specific phosphatase CheC
MKLQLKKGFLIPEHVKSALKKEGDYEWHLSALDEAENELHKEFTDLSFSEAFSRLHEMLGKKADGKKIVAVQIFGNFEKVPAVSTAMFERNKNPKKPGKHVLTLRVG